MVKRYADSTDLLWQMEGQDTTTESGFLICRRTGNSGFTVRYDILNSTTLTNWPVISAELGADAYYLQQFYQS